MRKVGLLVVFISLATGCAFHDVPLYLPSRGLEHPVPGGRGREVIVSIPFSDERSIRERCGMQKNGYDMDTADAVCQAPPEFWIARLLVQELRASGFDVSDESVMPAKTSAVTINGSLVKIFVEPVKGFWAGSLEADIAVKLEVTSETGLVAQREFFVKGWKGGVQMSTMKPYHTALDRATQALLEEMVRAIVQLMDRYPQLGFAVPPLPPLARYMEGTQR